MRISGKTKKYDESADSPIMWDRRGFLTMIGAAMLAPACGDPSEEELDTTLRAVNRPNNVAVSVGNVTNNQSIGSDSELLSIDTDLALYLSLGDQCRIVRNNGSVALYTVGEVRAEPGNDRVRMGLAARKRLETTNEFPAVLQTAVVAAGLSDAQAQAQGEFVERLTDDGVNTGLVILAPHGGLIERYTDEQALTMANALAAYHPTTWLCKGYNPGQGATTAWHITSTNISRNSFPGLDAIAERGFAYAVSFHGMGDDFVLVGGGAPLPLRQMVRNAIGLALAGSGITVELAAPNDANSGTSPHNLVNWLTAGGDGGVHIEQSKPAREHYGTAIANAVAGVFAQLL